VPVDGQRAATTGSGKSRGKRRKAWRLGPALDFHAKRCQLGGNEVEAALGFGLEFGIALALRVGSASYQRLGERDKLIRAGFDRIQNPLLELLTHALTPFIVATSS
jgi:hypothetical protein